VCKYKVRNAEFIEQFFREHAVEMLDTCLIYKYKLSVAFPFYPFLAVLPDILSVISLLLLHALLFNAVLVSICAVCSNMSGHGSWKDSKRWNGICFSCYRQVLFHARIMFLKNVTYIEIMQIRLKISI
jgi:hypothetical protein